MRFGVFNFCRRRTASVTRQEASEHRSATVLGFVPTIGRSAMLYDQRFLFGYKTGTR